MSATSQCREMVRNGEAGDLLTAMSAMLRAVGFDAMARDVQTERDFARLQHYARIILKHAVSGNTKSAVRERFLLLGLI